MPLVTVQSTFLAHPVHNLIFARWQAVASDAADHPGFSGTFHYERVADSGATTQTTYSGTGIRFDCTFAGGISYRTAIRITTDGQTMPLADGLQIRQATYIVAAIDIGTSVKGIDTELTSHPVPAMSVKADWDVLRQSHRQAFAAVLGRLSLRVDLPASHLPTDQRVAGIRAGEADPALPLLYCQYGRYLLTSSSICGELPANLQGKWNDRIDPPWECDYHFDINLQMNYWMAEAAAMPECAEALIQYVERFVPHARQAAMDLYGCRGVWFPLQTDAWGRATPESYGWSVWIGAAPWIARHLWQHYEYGGDRDYLRSRAYPFFREVALFYEDYLVADPDGTLQIMPSQSPENRFAGTGMWPVSIGISAAMDVQLAYDAFGYAIRSAEILGVDAGDRVRWMAMQSRLPPFRIGSDGRLLEWEREREEVEPGHRHLSHLYGLFPSDLFNPIDRPAEYAAAIRSLEQRLACGGGHTGWSRAWVACFFARIGRAEEMWQHLYALLTDFATVSLLDLHPPRIFQIDGNLGAVEAVLQSLVQCWGGKVHLLRALPAAWPTGSLSGIRVPGGHTLALDWHEGRLTCLTIRLGFGGSLTLAGLAGQLMPNAVPAADDAAPETPVSAEPAPVLVRTADEDLVISGTAGQTVRLISV